MSVVDCTAENWADIGAILPFYTSRICSFIVATMMKRGIFCNKNYVKRGDLVSPVCNLHAAGFLSL